MSAFESELKLKCLYRSAVPRGSVPELALGATEPGAPCRFVMMGQSVSQAACVRASARLSPQAPLSWVFGPAVAVRQCYK